MKRALTLSAYLRACSFADRGSIVERLASRTTRGFLSLSSRRKSIAPFCPVLETAPSRSSPNSAYLTPASRRIFAGPCALSSKRQPAVSRSLFILMRALASLPMAVQMPLREDLTVRIGVTITKIETLDMPIQEKCLRKNA